MENDHFLLVYFIRYPYLIKRKANKSLFNIYIIYIYLSIQFKSKLKVNPEFSKNFRENGKRNSTKNNAKYTK